MKKIHELLNDYVSIRYTHKPDFIKKMVSVLNVSDNTVYCYLNGKPRYEITKKNALVFARILRIPLHEIQDTELFENEKIEYSNFKDEMGIEWYYNEIVPDSLGKLLRSYRLSRNLTLKECSEQSGLSESKIMSIETDNSMVGFEDILTLMACLNVSIKDLDILYKSLGNSFYRKDDVNWKTSITWYCPLRYKEEIELVLSKFLL